LVRLSNYWWARRLLPQQINYPTLNFGLPSGPPWVSGRFFRLKYVAPVLGSFMRRHLPGRRFRTAGSPVVRVAATTLQPRKKSLGLLWLAKPRLSAVSLGAANLAPKQLIPRSCRRPSPASTAFHRVAFTACFLIVVNGPANAGWTAKSGLHLQKSWPPHICPERPLYFACPIHFTFFCRTRSRSSVSSIPAYSSSPRQLIF